MKNLPKVSLIMKNAFNITLACLVGLLALNLIITSCEKADTSEKKLNLVKILEQFNAGKVPSQQGALYEGSVVLQRINDDQYGIFLVNATDPQETGRLFMIQMTHTNDLENKRLDKAKVLFLHESLVIEYADGYYVAYIHQKPDFLTTGFNLIGEYRAYGIGSHSNAPYHTLVMSMINEKTERGTIIYPPLEVSCRCKTNPYADDCQSGGVGSTSCSTSGSSGSCSVSCDSGKYACCKS